MNMQEPERTLTTRPGTGFGRRLRVSQKDCGPAHLVFAFSAPVRGADATSSPVTVAIGDATLPKSCFARHGTISCAHPAGLDTSRCRIPTGTRSSGSAAMPPAVASTCIRLSKCRMKHLSHLAHQQALHSTCQWMIGLTSLRLQVFTLPSTGMCTVAIKLNAWAAHILFNSFQSVVL